MGRVVHTAAAFNFRQKISSGVDLAASEVVDVAVCDLESQCADDGYSVTGKMVGDVKTFAIAHMWYQAPNYQPLRVEEPFKLSMSPDIIVNGVIDLVATRSAAPDTMQVVDFKTSSKSKSQDEADRSLQLTLYHYWVSSQTGEDCEVVLDTLVNTKQIKRQKLVSKRDDIDHGIAYAHVSEVVKAIDAGAFPPTAPTNWWCSTAYCEFSSTCRFFRGDRK